MSIFSIKKDVLKNVIIPDQFINPENLDTSNLRFRLLAWTDTRPKTNFVVDFV